MKRWWTAALAAGIFLAGGCIKIKHEMKVEPIHVTVEITVKIDRELENFFGDIDKAPAKTEEKKENKQNGGGR